jgi:hypothetical protein
MNVAPGQGLDAPTRLGRRHALLALLAATSVLTTVLSGCGKDHQARIVPRPIGYQPERFPDIQLPPGYVLAPDHDQLAVVYGGGQVRRFDVSLVQQQLAKAEDHQDALAYFSRAMPALGWREMSSTSREQRWRKVDGGGAADRRPGMSGEELVVEAGRAGPRTTIHLRLLPVDPGADQH